MVCVAMSSLYIPVLILLRFGQRVLVALLITLTRYLKRSHLKAECLLWLTVQSDRSFKVGEDMAGAMGGLLVTSMGTQEAESEQETMPAVTPQRLHPVTHLLHQDSTS